MITNNKTEGCEFLLDISKLENGDIVLEAGRKPHSKAIQKQTKSQYSHAMLYDNNSIIHATGGGVYSKNPQRILVPNQEDLLVLRLKEQHKPQTMKPACDFARSNVGKLYDYRGVLASPFAKGEGNQSKQFCSRLVAQSYQKIGLDIVKNPAFCSPGEIERSENLYPVKGAVRIADEYDLLRCEKRDIVLELQEETFEWLKKVRENKNIRKIENICDQNSIVTLLNKAPEFDDEICKQINKTKYLRLFNADRECNPFRYNVKDFVYKIENHLEGKSKEQIIAQEVRVNKIDKERYGQEFAVYSLKYNQTKLRYYGLHAQLYKNLLDENSARYDVLKQVCLRLDIPLDDAD